MDEQVAGFQGQSQHKVRCGKYKRAGDGLIVDSIADDGYTYNFHLHNKPVNKKWIAKGFCPMHCCLLGMWEKLDNKWHRCDMDNLLSLVKLTLAASDKNFLDNPLLIYSVLRENGREMPPLVHQD